MENDRIRILVVDDEESITYSFKSFLTAEGYEVLTASDYQTAMNIIAVEHLDLIFADIILGENTGIQLLKEVKSQNLTCDVVIITGQPNVDTASESVRLGAYDYIYKPVRKDRLLKITQIVLRHQAIIKEKKQVEIENEKYRSHLEAIFRSVREAIITLDENGKILKANSATRNIFNRPKREIIGASLDTLFDQHPIVWKKIRAKTLIEEVDVKDFRIEYQRQNQPPLVLVINSSPLINRSANSIGAVLVISDVTRLTGLENELKERYGFHNIVGKGKKMQEIYRLIEDLVDTPSTVLISGESGTGKELIAKALHYTSTRSSKPMVTVNCSALSESLLESELFGHVKGAFTGAIQDRVGRFQAAHEGSIFLDEIGDISTTVQVKLLRVLQEKEFDVVGGTSPIKTDIRVIAATNHNLKDDIRHGTFREDLYYRLKVVEIHLPPLRERMEDIPLLARHFCKTFNKSFDREITGFSDGVYDVFMDYDWPGNIRELEHTIEYAFVRCREQIITTEYIPSEMKHVSKGQHTFSALVRPKESQQILKALEKSGWNKAKTARMLGLSRQTLYRKLQKYHISSESE